MKKIDKYADFRKLVLAGESLEDIIKNNKHIDTEVLKDAYKIIFEEYNIKKHPLGKLLYGK